MNKCTGCGANSYKHGICTYCGSLQPKSKKEKKMKIIKSDMGNFGEIYDTELRGDMNNINYAENCVIKGNMNNINKSKNITVIGAMNDY